MAKLATPTGLSASYTLVATTLQWNPVPNATTYRVYRNGGIWGGGSGTTYTDTSARAGISVTYWVTAYATGYEESDKAIITTSNPQITTSPTNFRAEYTIERTVLRWDAIPGSETWYKIWRGEQQLVETRNTSYVPNSSGAGTSGVYYITATQSPKYESAKVSLAVKNPAQLATPTGVTVSYSTAKTVITWTAVKSATLYKIYRDNATTPVETNKTTYTDTTATAGTSHTYKIVASNSPNYYDSEPATVSANNPAQLAQVTVSSTSQTATSITLNWNAVPHATSYIIERTDNIKTRTTVKGTTYTDTTAEAFVGATVTYKYDIIAVANGYYDSAPTRVSVAVKPRYPAPTLMESAQTDVSVTLSIVRGARSGTLILKRNNVQIATYTPSGTAEWQYTDTSVVAKRQYVYSVYTQGNANYYDSLASTITVYIGKDYTTIERQQAYLVALTRPMHKLCRLRFLYPNGSTAFALDNNIQNRRSKAFIQDGTVNANMQNGQRLTAHVTIANANQEFDFAFNKIWFGQEVALDEGLILPNGEEYWRQTGVFVIDNPSETINPNSRTVTYNLVDKWADLDGTLDGNLEGTYEVAVDTNIFNPVAALLSEDKGNGRPVDRMAPVFTEYFNSRTQKLPDGTTVSMVLSPYTLTIDGDGGTIGGVVLGLGGMVNAWVGYDNTGRLRMEPSQDDILDAQKAVLYRFRPEEVTLLGMAYTIKKEDLYNDYIVVGEQMDDYTQPGGRAQNLDPRSDTNVNIIGRKTKRESASNYATATQCKDLAEWRLKRSGILQKAVNFSCSQMFHIELNSLVEVVRTDKDGSPTERHLIQGYSRPLATSGSMTISAVSVNDFPIATVTEWPPA